MARASGADGVAEAGHALEADLHVLEADPAEDRDAVPLAGAGGGDLVAQRLQAHQRQLVLAGLGLLQGEHVDVVALEQGLDPVDAGAERVDVPGSDAHGGKLNGRNRAVPETPSTSRSTSSSEVYGAMPARTAPSSPSPACREASMA